MGESIDWRALLYPGEWAFRFFLGALLVWLVGREWHTSIAAIVFCALAVAAVLQVWVLLRSAKRGSGPAKENLT